jgi:regulator of sirC expression with transglutaminase-like and TPR domain
VTPREWVEAFATSIAADPVDMVTATHAMAATDHLSDLDTVINTLDEIGRQVKTGSLESLRDHLATACRFIGNSGNYYDAHNSYLDRVLDRRVGIPISLSLVTIEVGRRAGVPLVGIGLPGHFIIRTLAAPFVYIDPFERFRVVTPADCRNRFNAMAPPGARWDDDYLAPVGPHAMLYRMTGNLQAIHERRRDAGALRHILELRTRLPMSTDRDRHALLLADARLN